jgi:hypothetical protein
MPLLIREKTMALDTYIEFEGISDESLDAQHINWTVAAAETWQATGTASKTRLILEVCPVSERYSFINDRLQTYFSLKASAPLGRRSAEKFDVFTAHIRNSVVAAEEVVILQMSTAILFYR